jgi:hypothetical protein
VEGDKERKKETVKFTSVELIIILLLVTGFICPSLFGFIWLHVAVVLRAHKEG